jgi:hypothetical protein
MKMSCGGTTAAFRKIMKPAVLAVVALILSPPVAADWVKVGITDAYDVFIDPDSISAEGELRKSWEIRNLKTRARAGESDQYRMEYDCKAQKTRTLYWSVHTEHFALGELAKLALEASEWNPIRRYSTEWIILRIVCLRQPI